MQRIYGNLQDIKTTYIKQLQRFYEQRQLENKITRPEFASELAAISSQIHQPICCYLNRRGQVIRVAVGTPNQTQIPPEELPRHSSERLSGIHCVATQLRSQPPDEAVAIAMVRQRLDALVVLTVADGAVKQAFLAHLIPNAQTPWTISPELSLDDLTQQNFDDLAEEWEREISQAGGTYLSQEMVSDQDRVLLVGVQTEDLSPQRFEDGLEELVRLVETAGGVVLDKLRQKRSRPHPQTVVGQGKVEEIALLAQKLRANLIVFDRDISASQARNLEQEIGISVVDRTEVILDIFAQRARSGAGKLQVELAQLEYMLPRLRGRGREMSRLGAGIGTRGPGETRLETERRTIGRRIAQLQQEVNQLQAHRARIREQRHQQEIPVVALVGYTNAGKSTLLNVLTHAEVYTADQLFATLDPTTRKLVITEPETQQRRTILLTDTVGFIHELPPPLMDAFRATLEEVVEADALIHVVNLSHPAWENHITSVREILDQMPQIPAKSLIAFNKIDRADSETLAKATQEYPQAVFVSATQRLGLETLKLRSLQLIEESVEAIALAQNSL
ncbi:MAG: GTPase HflX [Chroococcidiopsis cubana SAG 39.79]|uniref:GTPase HflX n=1 Tax=Chroococcidiopsis cubana SAG 39.79 TaxID=388085 RepID=A0AB37UDW0_9CYAN|nr:GTPase HflX [Chroococcidiopsis cubana]MDZ4877046.1 GTPase HflX [Chroococcidiopsis cubana SAG 39.79]PSB61743.1 GTPase HflX [Chroococcidiopsis cubana CCALA 043]RUT06373.1 GTPase HflX [Chroococcidiopsis cubana SAG 39.79]